MENQKQEQERALSKPLSGSSPQGQQLVAHRFAGTEIAQRAELAAVRVAASARAEVESAFVMALKMPRNRAQARVEILESCKNVSFAARAKYKKPIGGSFVVGPSIRFAEEMIRAWGNIKVQSNVIYEDDERRIIFVNAIDLEKNLSYSNTITVEKIVERKMANNREVVGERLNSRNERVFIVKATDDEIMTKAAALISKEIRNSTLRLIPQDIIEDSMTQIEDTLRKGASTDIGTARKAIFDSFALVGVKPKDIEQYIGHSVDTLSPDEIADLRSVYSSIKEGQATWADYVETVKDADIPTKTETADMPATFGDALKAGDEKTHKDVKAQVGKAGVK